MRVQTWVAAGLLGLLLAGTAEAATLTLLVREPPMTR